MGNRWEQKGTCGICSIRNCMERTRHIGGQVCGDHERSTDLRKMFGSQIGRPDDPTTREKPMGPEKLEPGPLVTGRIRKLRPVHGLRRLRLERLVVVPGWSIEKSRSFELKPLCRSFEGEGIDLFFFGTSGLES